MFKVWNQHEHRWDIVPEAIARHAHARGARVIERPDAPPPVPSFEDPPQPLPLPPAPAAEIDLELDLSDVDPAGATEDAPTSGELTGDAADLEASSERTTAPLPVITDAELAARIGGGGASAIVLEFKESSNIRRAALDPGTGIVTVSFANGTTYRYGNFTPELMTAWKDAKSAGSWFHANVRARADRHPVIRFDE